MEATEQTVFIRDRICIALLSMRCHKVERRSEGDSTVTSLLFFEPGGTLLGRLDGAATRSVSRVASEIGKVWERSYLTGLRGHTRRMTMLLDLRDKVDVRKRIFRLRWKRYLEEPTPELRRELAIFVRRLAKDWTELGRRERAMAADVTLRPEHR